MYTQVVRPEQLHAVELDLYLDQAWYRMGQALFTCRFVRYEEVLRPAIWTRVRLEDYTFRRSLKRRMKRVESRYEVEVGPARRDREHERLYAAYLETARGQRPLTLDGLLGPPTGPQLFDTWSVRIYDEGGLIGASYFDVGERTIASISGIYDPAYTRDSLGFYTMLAEIRWARDQGMKHFYAGYIMPGEPSMDYKLRVDQVDWYEPETERWLPIEEFDRYELPTRRLHSAIRRVFEDLREQGLPVRSYENASYDLGAWSPNIRGCVEHPVVILCPARRPRDGVWVVAWHLDDEAYELMRCTPAMLLTPDGRSAGNVLSINESVARSPSTEDIAKALLRRR